MTTYTRVVALERRCTALEARLTALEARPAPTVDLTAVEARLSDLELALPPDVAAFTQRLTAVEEQLDPVTGDVLRDREA